MKQKSPVLLLAVIYRQVFYPVLLLIPGFICQALLCKFRATPNGTIMPVQQYASYYFRMYIRNQFVLQWKRNVEIQCQMRFKNQYLDQFL